MIGSAGAICRYSIPHARGNFPPTGRFTNTARESGTPERFRDWIRAIELLMRRNPPARSAEVVSQRFCGRGFRLDTRNPKFVNKTERLGAKQIYRKRARKLTDQSSCGSKFATCHTGDDPRRVEFSVP